MLEESKKLMPLNKPMSKIQIIPAILPKDFSEVQEKVESVKDFVKFVQIDACDGQFVPDASWPYRKNDLSFEKIIHEDEGLPFWDKVDYEIDLMANRPEEHVEEWIQAGAARVIIHVEVRGDISKALELIADRAEIGLAINIETSLDVLDQYADKASFIQCMGIDRIGFQGQAFDTAVLDKIKSIKNKYPDKVISVDGGVSLDNALLLIEAGATRLVVGSAIFGSEIPMEEVEKFKRLVK